MPALFLLTAGTLALLAGSGLFFHAAASRLGLGAAIAGAVCNLYDRVRHGATVDFISIGAWPVFNVADVGIVGGALLAAIFVR